MTRAWIGLDRFQRGTNLEAWLFTILRNFLYSEYRKRRREVEDVNGFYSSRLTISPEQQSHLDLQDLSQALQKLPLQHREALLLIAAEGLSYEEAAIVCDIPLGTLKSRVSRGREKLAQLLAVTPIKDHRLDQVTRAVAQCSWPFNAPVELLMSSAATQISFQNTGADSERSRKRH
jgi:RNA polymerase sigma-70 factor (ECF subfamily)